MAVTSELGKLHYSLLWEGTVLLALSREFELVPGDADFARGRIFVLEIIYLELR